MSTHQYAFRCGQWADIVGVEMSDSGRACYRAKFEDGKDDLVPIFDADNPQEFRVKPERNMEADCRAAFERSGNSSTHDVPFEDGFYAGVAWAEAGK